MASKTIHVTGDILHNPLTLSVSPSESRDSLFEKLAPVLRERIGCTYIDIKLVDEAGMRITSVADMAPGQQLVVKTLFKMEKDKVTRSRDKKRKARKRKKAARAGGKGNDKQDAQVDALASAFGKAKVPEDEDDVVEGKEEDMED